MFGTFKGLAPVLIVNAELDIVKDLNEIYALKMQENGSTCITYSATSQMHAFINFTTVNKAAKRAAIKIAHDFRALLDGKALMQLH